MSNTNLAQIANRVLNRPLMIMPDKLAVISSILEGRIGIEGVAPQADVQIPDTSRHIGNLEDDPSSSAGAKKPYRVTAGRAAIVPVIGSLVGRGGWMSALSGIQSYENIKHALNSAAADDTIKAIVLDIDSPGGEAVGAFETADAVRAAAAKKPVYAVATGLCCSAAYAIASAATSITTTKSSVVGSIGVVLLHTDHSHALHERGIVATLIHAGARKVDGSPYKPLTDDVKASLKAEVEKFNSLFVATVAEGRASLTPHAILAMEAGTYIGADAVAIGLADAVGSLEAVLSDISSRPTGLASKPPKGKFMSEITQAQLDQAVATATQAANAVAETKAAAVKVEHEASLKAAVEKAAGEAATAERTRLTAIVTSEEAKGREAAAFQFAIAGLDATVAKSALAAIPKAGAVVSGNALGLFVAPETKPNAEGNHGWDNVVAEMNKRG